MTLPIAGFAVLVRDGEHQNVGAILRVDHAVGKRRNRQRRISGERRCHASGNCSTSCRVLSASTKKASPNPGACSAYQAMASSSSVVLAPASGCSCALGGGRVAAITSDKATAFDPRRAGRRPAGHLLHGPRAYRARRRADPGCPRCASTSLHGALRAAVGRLHRALRASRGGGVMAAPVALAEGLTVARGNLQRASSVRMGTGLCA